MCEKIQQGTKRDSSMWFSSVLYQLIKAETHEVRRSLPRYFNGNGSGADPGENHKFVYREDKDDNDYAIIFTYPHKDGYMAAMRAKKGQIKVAMQSVPNMVNDSLVIMSSNDEDFRLCSLAVSPAGAHTSRVESEAVDGFLSGTQAPPSRTSPSTSGFTKKRLV